MADVLRVVETDPSGLVRLEGLPGWRRIGDGRCGACGRNEWSVIVDRSKQTRLVCVCVRPQRGERRLRVVALPEGGPP